MIVCSISAISKLKLSFISVETDCDVMYDVTDMLNIYEMTDRQTDLYIICFPPVYLFADDMRYNVF